MSAYREGESWAWGGEIGPVLEQARERLGLSLKEVEKSTKIRARYLEGLEKERPAELPRGSYVQGFLRSYAGFLGLDVDEMGRRFRERGGGHRSRRAVSGQEEAPEREKFPEGIRPRDIGGVKRGALIAFSLAVLALTVAAASFYLSGGGSRLANEFVSGGEVAPGESPGNGAGEPQTGADADREPDDGSGEAQPSEARLREAARSSEETPASGQAGGPLRARVTVERAESWIQVESEEGVDYTGIAEPGFARSFESERSLTITTGNAGAIEVEVNGQEYGSLGESGEVTSRSFTLKSGG